MKKCSVNNCQRIVLARNLCSLHYQRARHDGSLLKLVTPTMCSVEGCSNAHRARGLCITHYNRLREHGRLHKIVMRGDTAVARILAKINIVNGCWIFTGCISGNNNYGAIRDGVMRFAHVVMYEHKYGLVPPGLELDHICKTPACCNPDHLEAVTHGENVRRGRSVHVWKRRERNSLGQWI